MHELTRDGSTRIDVVTSGLGSPVTIERPSKSLEILVCPVGKREPHFWRAAELLRWTWSALSTCRRLARSAPTIFAIAGPGGHRVSRGIGCEVDCPI
jgi:hypothetical protein